MAIKNLEDYINNVVEELLTEKAVMEEDLYNVELSIRVSKSKNKEIHHLIARTRAVFKVANSNYKNTQGKVNYINKKVDTLIKKRISKLKIYKQKLRNKKWKSIY